MPEQEVLSRLLEMCRKSNLKRELFKKETLLQEALDIIAGLHEQQAMPDETNDVKIAEFLKRNRLVSTRSP